jgi:hypothetical protein
MAMLIAPDGPSRDALLAAFDDGDVRCVSPDHPDFFTSALKAGAIVYAPSPPAAPDRMRRVLGACNAPGVAMIVFVRTPDDALEPEEQLLRRDGKPYVVLAAPAGSPALGPALRRALNEGELQGRVLDLTASVREPASAEATAEPVRAAPKLDQPGSTRATPEPAPAAPQLDQPASAEATPEADGPAGNESAPSARLASTRQTPTQITSKPGRAKAIAPTSNDSPKRPGPASNGSPTPSAPWPRWLLPAAAIAVLVALQAMGVRVLPSGCSATPATDTPLPNAR